MAAHDIDDGAEANINEDDWERIRKVRNLRELYHGRFTNRQCATLLKHHNWDILATNTFVLDALPGQLREVLSEDDWQLVENVRRNDVLRNLARLNRIGQEIRLYACIDCDNVWWRRVPTRKPVSRCHGCRTKYDPIPREEEWGLGQFRCVCGHEFKAFAMMDLRLLRNGYTGKSKSLCHKCYSALCEPMRILPPEKHVRGGKGRRRAPRHSCTAPNCYNRRMPGSPNEPIVFVCVHPNSWSHKVHGDGSARHASSGSTVNTFLPQDDIMPDYEPSLADIEEIDSGENDND